MKRMLMLEFKNCIDRKEFKFTFAFLFLISIGSFLITCYRFYGQGLPFIRSAYEVGIIQGVYSRSLLQFELMLLPLFSIIIYSDSYYSDAKSGVFKSILTRTNRKTYVFAKSIVIFTVTFASFFISFFLNQLLIFIVFPVEGYDNNYSLPPYDLGIQNYHSEDLFDLVRLQYPFFYNMLYMLIISLFAALFALIAFGVYFYVKKGKFVVILGLFLGYIVLELALNTLGFGKYSIIHFLLPGSPGSFNILLSWMVLLLVLSFVMIVGQLFTHEAGIEK